MNEYNDISARGLLQTYLHRPSEPDPNISEPGLSDSNSNLDIAWRRREECRW